MEEKSDSLNSVFRARSLFNRRKYERCIEICTKLLAENPYDMAVWFLKTRALTMVDYIDDTDMEEEGIAEMLMDDNALAKAPRPGTSLKRPMTGAQRPGSRANTSTGQGIRPLSRTGRPLSGFLRPGTSSLRPASKGGISVQRAFQGSRAGTARPVSSGGRFVRLGTQSMLSASDRFNDPDRVNVSKYARRPAMAKALTDFLVYSAHTPKKALELCAEATKVAEFKDPWWKCRLGKCYYQLGMLREAEKQFLSANKQQETIVTYLELAKVYIKLDQPQRALDTYLKASDAFPADVSALLGIARIYDMLNDGDAAIASYKRVLQTEASNAEAIACLASHYFYFDQPELALRFYQRQRRSPHKIFDNTIDATYTIDIRSWLQRGSLPMNIAAFPSSCIVVLSFAFICSGLLCRLLQMGVVNSELLNNIGLCCFHAGQYDICLGCFERALLLCDDDTVADIWYNIGQVAIGIGDQNLAYRAFKTAISNDGNHAESFTNLGILQVHKGSLQKAKGSFEAAEKLAPHLHEPFYNSALLAQKIGNFQVAYKKVKLALEIFPEHQDSKSLLLKLESHFTTN